MTRALLHSHDPGLHEKIESAPAGDFRFIVCSNTGDSNRETLADLVLHKQCDVVILDLDCCPAEDRFRTLGELQNRDIPVAIVGEDNRRTAVELLRRGVQNYCRKPVTVPELNIAVRWAVEYAAAKRHLADYPKQSVPSPECGQLIGSSTESQAVYELIRRVADLDAPVLITGESGTGKELIAQAIHSLSSRAQDRFVAVSCGAIPESLVEAELFGCERGAFTGAATRRTGYFEEAGHGTLLLDEIGELSNNTQVKLLRVLQQREFTRLGSSRAIPLTARILFATNRNLKRMVTEGTFRDDLYYRLNVIGIQSPPLRERCEDIIPLAEHFLAKYAHSFRKSTAAIEPSAAVLLTEYAWPGNVRELENVIQSALIRNDGDMIRASDLPEEIRQTDLKRLNDALRWSSFEDQLRDYKVKLALDAIKECNGNKTLAAQSLNISRTYLHRLIREPGDECPALRVA